MTALLCICTATSLFALAFRFRLEPNISALLPDEGEASALKRYVRAFGGGDLAIVLVTGANAERVALGARDASALLSSRGSVVRATERLDPARSIDPMLLFRYADAAARDRISRALTPEQMRPLLEETRAMLLAPGSGALTQTILADPLRLAQLVFDPAFGGAVSGGVRTQPDGAFANESGTAHLVLIQPKGQALRGADAEAFVRDANSVLETLRARYPDLQFGLTGGHAIAAATEATLIRDLELSSVVALMLSSAAFALIFRRVRALVAVVPPLVLGTLWTAGLATLMPFGVSAIAVAFMSVVIGVGVDTGVHVYAALLEARRQGHSPDEAAAWARKRSGRSVLTAAVTASGAFLALLFSEIHALRQLGLLCALGEVLTAVAIVVVTPEIGKYLERGAPPEATDSRWTHLVCWVTAGKRRSLFVVGLALVPIVAFAVGFGPSFGNAIVAIRPETLEPLKVQQQVFDHFGGQRGQWVVLLADRDSEAARLRGDRLTEHLSGFASDLEAVDSLSAIVPSATIQQERFESRDALPLGALADELEAQLAQTGFQPKKFESFLASMRHPARPLARLEDAKQSPASVLLSRYIGEDAGETLVALYVRPKNDPASIARLESAIRSFDPKATLTGYGRLEHTLRASLRRDMPTIGLVAFGLVLAGLSTALRRPKHVALALFVVVAQVAALLVLIRVMNIPLHAYDALVLPVLLGISVDEGMFLLHRANDSKGHHAIDEAIRVEGPPVLATALTTACGFGALTLCEFSGLRDLGLVGAMGTILGVALALLVVPAGLRLIGPSGLSSGA